MLENSQTANNQKQGQDRPTTRKAVAMTSKAEELKQLTEDYAEAKQELDIMILQGAEKHSSFCIDVQRGYVNAHARAIAEFLRTSQPLMVTTKQVKVHGGVTYTEERQRAKATRYSYLITYGDLEPSFDSRGITKGTALAWARMRQAEGYTVKVWRRPQACKGQREDWVLFQTLCA